MEKRLLILDINGLLGRKVGSDYEGPTDLDLGRYKFILRPGAREFLADCFEHFSIGFLSSTTYKNANPMLELLLTSDQSQKILFKWFRDRTAFDPDWNQETPTTDPSWGEEKRSVKIESYSTVKRLMAIWENPEINRDRNYSRTNTLICDDSWEKLRFNPRENCLIVPTYIQDEDYELSTLFETIERQFETIKKDPDV